jgi:hypothetical protein
VANVNDAPTLANAIADQAATEDQAFSFAVPANTFADVDAPYGDTLTYTATLASGAALPGWLAFDAATRTFSGTPANGDVGAVDIKITVTDGAGTFASDEFRITVANVNDAPTLANAIADQAATEDQAFSFAVPANTFADVDAPYGDTLTYTATLAGGAALPSWLTFDTATRTFSGTPANGDVGAIDVKVTATDGSNAFAQRRVPDHGGQCQRRADAGQRHRCRPEPRPKTRRSASPCRRTRSRMWTRPTATR